MSAAGQGSGADVDSASGYTITVASSGGYATAPIKLRYADPTVLSVTPEGTTRGGVPVVLTGSNFGFDAANPYAAARGPSPSTATFGNWGEMTYNPEADPRRTERVMIEQSQPQIDQAMGTLRKFRGGDRLADEMQQRVDQRREGLQPLGNPFGFGGGR
jgi:hypothetical protein